MVRWSGGGSGRHGWGTRATAVGLACLLVVTGLGQFFYPSRVEGETPVCDFSTGQNLCSIVGCDAATCTTPIMPKVSALRELFVKFTAGTTLGTVDQGLAGSAAQGWWVRLTDGTDTALITANGEVNVAQGAPAPASSPWPVYLSNGTASSAFASAAPVGNELALITRPIAPANQVVSGTVTANTGAPRAVRTYTAAGAVAPATTTNDEDVWTLTGGAGVVVSVLGVECTATGAAAVAITNIRLAKRSAANSGGTSVAETEVPHDSNDAAAGATVLSYTAEPTLGALVGYVGIRRSVWPNGAAAAFAPGKSDWSWSSDGKPIILRGTSEVLGVNMGGTGTMPNSMACSITWTEE